MNKKLLLFGILVLIFLAGCINVTYKHDIKADGTSTLEQSIDLTGYIEATKSIGNSSSGFDSSQLGAMCATMAPQLSQGTDCTVNGNVLSFKRSFKPQDGFYTFESTGGITGGKYKVVISKIPAKAFVKDTGTSSDQLGVGAGQTVDTDLTDKVKNLEIAKSSKQIGMNMTYVVTMSAPITKASAGNYNAKIDGNKATFDLIQVFQDSAPLVVEAEGGSGMLPIIGVVVGVIVLLLLLWFFVFNKKK